MVDLNGMDDPRPADRESATLVGRVWRPDVNGPAVAALRGDEVVDISAQAPTVRDLCESDDPAGLARSAAGASLGPLADVLNNTPRRNRDVPSTSRPLERAWR